MSARLTRGINAATLTPIDEAGHACMELLAGHCRRLLDAGCNGIVLLGTTGEANSFSVDERRSILESLLSRGIPAGALMVGTGCCAIPETVSLSKHALSLGVERVLVLPPFYYKGVSPQGVIEAYSRTIEAIGDHRLRLYFYHIPQMSGVAVTPDIIDAVRERFPEAVAGVKDSSGDWPSTQALCERFGARLDVLVGSERFLVAALRAGASGCVTATANVFADQLNRLYAKRDDGDAVSLQERAASARAIFDDYPMVAALKETLARRTGDARWRLLRPPLAPLASVGASSLAERIAKDGNHSA